MLTKLNLITVEKNKNLRDKAEIARNWMTII
jgi:hypothetical protein